MCDCDISNNLKRKSNFPVLSVPVTGPENKLQLTNSKDEGYFTYI